MNRERKKSVRRLTAGLVVTLVLGAAIAAVRHHWPGSYHELFRRLGWESSPSLPDRVQPVTTSRFFAPKSVGFPIQGHPLIASVTLVDLDQDRLTDILVCDMLADRIG